MTGPRRNLKDLIEIMERLLAPGGCPWDREQTPKSLTPFAIEEAHELAEAIERGDLDGTKEELGDLLLQVVFHTCLTKRDGKFDLGDVIQRICEKLVHRHPHVFGDQIAETADEVLKNWNEIKGKEKAKKILVNVDNPLGIPKTLPALQRSQKIGDKTKNLKFDWASPQEVLNKVEEEFGELKQAFASGNKEHTLEELGDVFFVLAQLARHLKGEAESIARAANRKFESRFSKLLELAKSRNLKIETLSVWEKEKLWQEVKKLKS